jgi:hypothetical protein
MAGSISGPPDPFSLAPLVALLPERGDLSRLPGRVSSLFARHESVERLKVEASEREVERSYAVEAAMLRTILDWLAVKPGGAE